MISQIALFAVFLPLLINAGNVCGISPNIQKYENIFNGTDNSQLKIINGHESVQGDWPWLVHLIYSNGYATHICTGTIIGKKWVLTAVHCEITSQFYHVIYYGNVNYKNAKTTTIMNSFPFCSDCAIDPYNVDTIKNIDIRLLELAEPLNFDNDTTSPICLTREISSKPGDWNVVAGWGKHSRKFPKIAREDKIPIDSSDYCSPFIGEKEICAGIDSTGVTGGDSGGPLMAIKNGKWYQHGITSRGYPEPTHRAAYTDITKFCDWIKKTTKGDIKCDDDNIFE